MIRLHDAHLEVCVSAYSTQYVIIGPASLLIDIYLASELDFETFFFGAEG